MKGCLKIGAYIVGGIFVLIVIAAIFGGNRPSSSRLDGGRTASVPTFTATPGGSVAAEPEVTNTPAMTFTAENWALLDSDPDAYEGAVVDIVGKVFNAPDRTKEFVGLQMWALPGNNEGNTLVRYGDPNFQVENGDYVRVQGVVQGAYEGQNLMGGKVMATVINADKVEVVDALAAAPAAIRAVEVNQEQTQHDLAVTVAKVEYAPGETRVHVIVRNNSATKANIHAYSAKAVQGSTQFEAESLTDYQEVQSTLLPGVESTGVLVFPKMDPNTETRFYLTGRTEDYSLDFEDYVFTVAST